MRLSRLVPGLGTAGSTGLSGGVPVPPSVARLQIISPLMLLPLLLSFFLFAVEVGVGVTHY